MDNKEVDAIVAKLEIVRSEVKKLEDETKRLEENLKSARGTGDHTEKAVEAVRQAQVPQVPQVPRVVPPTLRDRIKTALLRESLSIGQLSKALNETPGRVSDEMRTLRSQGQVYNVGNADNPMWTWRIGDNTDTRILLEAIRRLISERPMTTKELAEATGARISRVGGVLVAIQRSDDQIFNLGNKHTARWFLASGAQRANLPPKKRAQ